MWSTRTTKIGITHATLTLTYWPENGMRNIVPSPVASVPHMIMVHEIGNKPRSGHGWTDRQDRWMDGVKPIYPNIYTNIGNFVLSIFSMKIITPPSAHYKITLFSTNCSHFRFHLYFLLICKAVQNAKTELKPIVIPLPWPNKDVLNMKLIQNMILQVNTSINSLWPSDLIRRLASRSTLAQVMACCLMTPSHYLNQCWLMISEVLWHSPDSNFTENTSEIYRWIEFEIY